MLPASDPWLPAGSSRHPTLATALFLALTPLEEGCRPAACFSSHLAPPLGPRHGLVVVAAGWALAAWPDHVGCLAWAGGAEPGPEQSPLPRPTVASLVCPFGPARCPVSPVELVKPGGDRAAPWVSCSETLLSLSLLPQEWRVQFLGPDRP